MRSRVARPGSQFPRLLAIAYSSLALGFAVAVSILALRRHISVPYLDDWRLLDEMYRTPLGGWLFSVQTGHRMPATLLLLQLDQALAGGRMHLLVAASLACAWISAALLALALRGSRASEPDLRRALLGFGIFALFWSNAGFNFQWGVNQGSVWTPMWLLVSVLAVTRAMEGLPAKPAARWVLLAAGAALLATFGHGMGLLTWAALLAIVAAGRMPWRIGAGVAAGALVSVGLYSLGLFGSRNAPAQAGSLLALFVDRPGELALFVCAFLGAPIGWALQGLGAVGANGMQEISTAFGAVATALACAYGALVFRRRAALPAFGLVGFGLIVFALGGALLVGLTRLEFYGASQAVDRRFLSWSTLFWIGGAWALGSLAPSRGARVALAGSLAALSLAMLPAFFEARDYAAARKQLANDLAFALVLGARPDPLLVGVMRQSPTVVGRAAGHLARERRSPFDDERSALAGTSFAERFTVSEQRSCGGAPELKRREARDELATVSGRLDRDAATPAYFVVVDSNGLIRGLGEERPSPPGAPPGRRWGGVIAPFAPGERYAAWAIQNDDRSACRVGEVEAPPEGSWRPAARPPS